MSMCSRSPVKIVKSKSNEHNKGPTTDKKTGFKEAITLPCMIHRYKSPESRKVTYIQFFKQHYCYDLLPSSSKLVILDTELSIQKAFFALVFNNVRASILWNSTSQSFIGMLTITDFIKVLVNDYGKHFGQMDDYENSTIEKWRSMDKSTENQPLISVSPESNLYDAARKLIRYRCHRLPVIDQVYGNPLYILTHKRILNYLHLNRNALPQDTFMAKSLEELRLGTYVPNVHAVSQEATVIDALRLFVKHHVSCLPVVDSENCLVELYAKFDAFNLAVTRTYNNLDETIYSALSFHRANRERYPRPMTCQKTATLNSVIEKMVNSRIHRLVIVDSKNRLEGVISLSDILRFIIQSHTETNTKAENYLRVPTQS